MAKAGGNQLKLGLCVCLSLAALACWLPAQTAYPEKEQQSVGTNADDNPFIGTWKLNLLKSKILNQDGIRPVPLTKSIVTYELVRNQVKVTDDDAFTDGHSIHMEWIGKFDGKDYPVTGDPTADTWSYKKLNDHTLIFTTKKDGKIQAIRHMTVSADGKTRISTGTRTDANGKKASVTAIYEKD